MKILYVTTALNAPLHTGCTIRTINICRQLNQNAQVTMLAVAPFFIEESVEFAKRQFDAFELIKLKEYSTFFPAWGRFLKKWHMHWPFSRGLGADPQGQALFERLVNRHDLVWFHTLGAAFPFRLQKFVRSVMDLDDLNHCKYDLRSCHETNFRFRCSARVQSMKWKRHEFKAIGQYDMITVCSEQDRRYLGAENIRVLPNGFARPDRDPVWTRPDPLRLGFIGTLGYGPNYDGLVWFREKVWPLIRKQTPGITLRIVGSPPPPQYHVPAEGFEYAGYVQDPTEEIRTWSAMIVPLLFGGGTRIKIIEAFSRMCPVVSTSVGAHGIEAEHDRHLWLADTADDFARSCLSLSASPEAGQQLALAAWQLFLDKYTWDRVGLAAREIVEDVMK